MGLIKLHILSTDLQSLRIRPAKVLLELQVWWLQIEGETLQFVSLAAIGVISSLFSSRQPELNHKMLRLHLNYLSAWTS